MNTALWIVQAILAVVFLRAGYIKAFQSLEVGAKRINWISDVPPILVRFIGISELLAGVGLIAPAVTGILPSLTVLAATGLMVVMLSATIFHLWRQEFLAMGFVLILFLLATFVAYGRSALVTFS